MASTLPVHPFGLTYILLKLGALLIRLPTYIALFLQKRTISPDVRKSRIQVPSRDHGRTITVDVYDKVGRLRRTTGTRRVHINFHGSGFTIPSLGADADFCTRLALDSAHDAVVLDADYRKAPEHPFPAAYQDAQDVLRYVRNRPEDFDIRHVTLGGFSAGANLAMAVAVNDDDYKEDVRSGATSKNSPQLVVTGVTSFYGNTDMSKSYDAPGRDYDSGIILPKRLRAFFYKGLILPGQSRTDPRLSPAHAPLDRWPAHVFFACGTADDLHDAGQAMARELKKAGRKDVTFVSVEREAHSFDKNFKEGSGTAKKTHEVYRRAIEMIDRAHG